ncbi:unnamed protein product [Adineta ricciae]|uniref:Uncharacterized protein n=1 Tax=Adineta ricciae TaxID=249248 RepID=A0A816F6V9_ADIRI|nr:unnamed protein product [Adineta ricciae]
MPVSRTDVRHKNEVEVELKPPSQQQQQQQQPQQQQTRNTFQNNVSPMSTVSYPPVVRPIGITNNRVPAMFFDENTPTQHYQTPKRRILTNSTQTQTFNQNDQYLQQLKALNEETVVKNEKIHILLRELTDCQVIIKQQEQQLTNGKKERDQLCSIVDERSNDLRNLKQKNEQLEQMIRNEKEHKTDEKKLISLLQEAQEEREQLINQQRQTHERIYKFEEQLKYYENDATKMRDHLLCSKLKLDKKTDENECLTSELTNMKKRCDRLEQENQKIKLQIDFERKKNEECTKLKALVDIELQNSIEKFRSQRYEYETKIGSLDEALKYSQKQNQILQQNQRLIDEKHENDVHQLKHHIRELEVKIEEVIKDKALLSIRCGELIDENHKLEKALTDKEDDYDEKLCCYKEKNLFLSTQVEEMEKKLNETKKQLDIVTMEKDETLADMLVAVRVASELRYGKIIGLVLRE